MGNQPQSGPIQVPNPSDTRLHFESYQNMAKMLNQMRGMTVGNTREVINNIVHVKLSSVVTDAITGDEVTWDYAAEEFVTMDGGHEFDGTEFPYLIPANGNWIPSVSDVVVVYEVIDNTDAESRWIFYPLAKLNNSFVPSIDEEDNTLLRIQTGTVYLNEEDSGTDVTDGTGFALSSDAYLVVEWTIELSDGTGAKTPTVTSTIQTESVQPNFIATGSTEVTFKWVIGQILSNEYTSWWWGDIHHDFPCTPKYHEDVQGDDAQTVNLAAVSEATSVDDYDVTDGSNFLEIRKVGHKFSFGNIIDIDDDGTSSPEYKFGGTDDDIEETSLTEANELNKITLTPQDLEIAVTSGLTQLLTSDDGTDIVIEALGKWIGIEAASAMFKHLDSPATSTGDDEHWVEFQVNVTGGIVIDGSSAVDTLTVRVDDKGHVWYVNNNTQPSSDENYRYSACPGVTADDIIFSTTQGTVIDVANKCYTSVGLTEAALTSPVPTVTEIYTTCSSCTSSQTNEIWKNCPEPGSVEYYMPENTTTDPAVWGCVSSAWVKMFKTSEMTSTTATVTSVLEQCEFTVVDCDDLVGWPGSDDFGGTGCDSGAVNDTNYDIRWSETKVGTPTYSITGGALAVEIPDPNEGIPASDGFSASGTDSGVGGIGNIPNDRWAVSTSNATWTVTGGNLVMDFSGGTGAVRLDNIKISVSHPGDFTLELPFVINTFGNDQNWIGLVGKAGGVDHAISWTNDAINGKQYRQNPPTFTDLTTTDNSGTLKVERVSGVIRSYHSGVQLGPSTNETGNLTEIRIDVRHDAGTDLNVTMSGLTAVDGSGDPILISTGGAATESSLTLANNIPSQSGDFACGVDIDVTSVTGSNDGPQMALKFGDKEVGYIQNDSVGGWYWYDGTTYHQDASAATTNRVAMYRTGSTFKMFIGGAEVYSASYTGSSVPKLVSSNFEGSTPVDGITGKFDDFTLSDNSAGGGSGLDIYIDPTGNAC